MFSNSIKPAIDAINDTPLNELGPVLQALMERVIDHRASHNGFVPFELFPLVLGIAGQYTCFETVPRVANSEGVTVGYLLSQRGGEEQGWQGQFQIPGVALVNEPGQNMMDAAQTRLEREIDFISPEAWALRRHQLEAIGLEAHDEPERNTTCLTVVKALNITEQEYSSLIGTLGEKWRFFPIEQLSSTDIVDHHLRTLSWMSRPDRQEFELVDLRQ